MKNLICLGGGVEALPIIRRVKELGFTPIVVDGNPNAPGFALGYSVVASCYHGDQALAALLATNLTFDGVLCCAVDAPHIAADIRAAFGLPGISPEAAKLSVDKLKQKSEFTKSKIPCPTFIGVTVEGITSLPGNGWVIKPADSRGGRGVQRLLPGVDWREAFHRAKSYSHTGRVMVEQWLSGPQLSTESIIQGGKVLFTGVGLRNYDRLNEFAPLCIEDGYDMPPGQFSDFGWTVTEAISIENQMDDIIETACAALGWDNLTVKGDLVISDGKPYVIELAARLSGGFFASHGIAWAYGVDFVGAAIKMALGYIVEPPSPSPRAYVSQRYIFPERSDIGRKVLEIKQDVSRSGDMFFSSYAIKPGDKIQTILSHADRWGQATCTGVRPGQARTRAEGAVKAMKEGVILG